MVRKITAALAIAALSAGFAFAQDDTAAQKPEKKASKFEISAGGGLFLDVYMSKVKDGDSNSPAIGGGAVLFFDATYIEIGVDIKGDSQKNGSGKKASTYVGFSALGKYPIALSEKIKLFPLLGVDYQLFLSQKFKVGSLTAGKQKRGDFSSEQLKTLDNLSVQVGVGADIGLTERVYLRPEFVYGIKLNSLDTLIGHGPRIKVAAGFKF